MIVKDILRILSLTTPTIAFMIPKPTMNFMIIIHDIDEDPIHKMASDILLIFY